MKALKLLASLLLLPSLAWATTPVLRGIDSISASGGSLLNVPLTGSNLVSDSATQTLTNKTLSTGSSWGGSTIGVGFGGTGSASTPSAGQLLIGTGSVYAVATPTQELEIRCNGSSTSYTLANTPNASSLVKLYVDGSILRQGSGFDYTISSATITLASACATGQTLYAVYTH